jgi:hypothetical protein
MPFYEDKRDGVVKPLLARYGTAVQLIVPAAGTYTAETGSFTSGTEAVYTAKGLVGSFRKSRKSGEDVQSKNRYVYLDPSGLQVAPMPGNRLRVANVEYEITDVDTIEPGGVAVLYQLEVRLP